MVHSGPWAFLFDCLILHQCYDTVLTTFYPCGWLCNQCPSFSPLEVVKTIFGDINVLSIWVHFKSDACFILWRHLLTSEISVLGPQRDTFIIHKYLWVNFGGQCDFGCGTMCNMTDPPELTYIWHDERGFAKPIHVKTTICCVATLVIWWHLATGRMPLLFYFKLLSLFFMNSTPIKKKKSHVCKSW